MPERSSALSVPPAGGALRGLVRLMFRVTAMTTDIVGVLVFNLVRDLGRARLDRA